ncbi:MAG: exonuclease domain-containing protein [Succinivibrio sp.]
MSIFSSFSGIEIHRRRCQKFANSKRCPEKLREFYLRELPDSHSYIDECKFTSIDFETTGLKPNEDYVLSIGGICLKKGVIDFTTSFHYYVNNSKHIKKDSAVINQITPEQLLDGKDPVEAMLLLLDTIAGGVVLMHCKFIETSFIKSTLGLRHKDPLPFLSLDTMSIESKLQRTQAYKDVRLAAIREKRGLPAYDSHNALIDSLSTAEVFLAQEKDIFKNKRPTLLPLYKRSL